MTSEKALMKENREAVNGEKVVAFVDMGTNSVRIMIVRINPNHSYTIISRQKEMIRLGAGEFSDNTLKPEAMDRAVAVCRNFAIMARSFKANKIIVVATSATREAKNQSKFLLRLKREAGVDVHVISGKEEARLIYLGVASGINLSGNALFIDIGGGSTELVIGDEKGYQFLDSLKLGAIRLTMLHLEDHEGPISGKRYQELQEFVSNKYIRSFQSLRRFNVKRAFGSSGTIQCLAEVCRQVIRGGDPAKRDTMRLKDLKQVIELLCSLSVKERMNVPGMNPKRADIIIGGAVILDTVLSELKIPEIAISERELRDGLLVNYLFRIEHPLMDELSIRQRNVFKLGRRCGFDEPHAGTVARLSLALFDSARDLDLHNQGQVKRELLYYAAQLHDIGTFISYHNHQANSAYLIRNADLLGFNQDELVIMAGTVFFHRKALPDRKHPQLRELDPSEQEVIKIQSVFLRLAESLDRSHGSLVENARFRGADSSDTVVLEITSSTHCQLELWGVQNHRDVFRKVFGKKLEIIGRN